jgi:transposase
MDEKKSLDFQQFQVKTANLDHHGLVAAVYYDLGIGAAINQRLNQRNDPRRIVSPGDGVLAMVLNSLGFTNRRLYLSPQFFQDKPVDRLLGDHLEARHLDDHALGKILDEIDAYGSTRLFAEISLEIGLKHNFFGKTAHVDSTSISVEGEYNQCGEKSGDLKINRGFSKDHRPDLNQVVINLCTSGPCDFPFWMETKNGKHL